MENNKIGFDIPHSAIDEITSISSALNEILDVPIYQEMLDHAIWQEGFLRGIDFKSITDIAGLTAYNEIVSLIDTNALYNIVSAFNYNNDTLQAMFNSTAIEEFQFILSTDNGVNTLQSLYDSVVIESPHHNESEGNSNTIEDNTIGERKKLDVKELSISERVQLYFVVIELIVSLISSFTDSTEDTLKEMKENSSQQLKIEQQQLDEQVRHNKEMERLQEGNNQALNKIGDELERANNLMEKSGTD